ncbi:unnamed protein product [Rotaria sordida]|uniref:Uncharacterized protein n=1 Tax=Rotaria sordida TaxID=392033 RepID=A0A815USW6_9BILA|nr:unnamed protein product [Rotaria sordida]CAF1521311.1 unnamed protein product [Rotaria sordida]
MGEKLSGANASSFRSLVAGYAKDSYNVYYMGKKLSGANASSFQSLGAGYAKDSHGTYFMGQRYVTKEIQIVQMELS